MLKFTCLVLLVAVAISWSHVDAKPKPAALIKRQVSSDELGTEVDQPSNKSQKWLTTKLLAGLLLSTVDSKNSAELDQLTLAFKKAADKNWDSIDDYATELFKIYEEVTGRKPED